MKKPLSAVLLGAALCIAWPAYAADDYLKASIGTSRYSDPGSTDNETALSLAYGAKLDPTWGYEVGYVHLGKLGAGSTVWPGLRSQVVYGAGVAHLPLNSATRVYSKVGLAIVNTKFDVGLGPLATGSESRTNTNLMAGVGLDYQISPQVTANVEYQYFGTAYQFPANLSAWTVGLKYGF